MASNKRFLKTYARFDGSGRIVPSSTILRKNKPKVGSWKEVQTYLCCNYEPVPFISVWRTTETNESISLPYSSDGTYSGIINWGDGTTSDNSYANRTHTYATAGDYTVTITGTIIGFSFDIDGEESDRTKIITINQWGSIQLGDGSSGGGNSIFSGCSNLNLATVIDIPNLTNLDGLTSFFADCTSLTSINRISEWDVSGADSTSYMFANTLFNQDISSWNVSNVQFMQGMFSGATLFNQPLNSWNMSNVIDTISMFYNATSFNQPLNTWNVSGVTSMINMFYNAQAFNQNIGSWNVSSVTNMNSMFTGAIAFNNGGSSDIGNWNISNVTDIDNMFRQANVFNQNINAWNTINIINMSGVFFTAEAFNQPLNNWNTSNVTSMDAMFYGLGSSMFNQNIGNWDVSSVTSMAYMFAGSKFNQNISGWDVSSVSDMFQMFRFATVFNQNLSSWCVSLIPSTPTQFSTGASAWVLPKPVWGTCP
jgi:surface protein